MLEIWRAISALPCKNARTCRVSRLIQQDRRAWSAEDGEHVATVAEFPSLSWLAPTPVEALAGLADVVRDVLSDLAASGDPVPQPLSERTYSGRFVVRVPAEVHRRLVREAAEQHVSLNRLVSDRLARA
jgi:hypothetical protein